MLHIAFTDSMKMRLITILPILLFLIPYFCNGQTFYFSTKKDVKRDSRRKERNLRKEAQIDLPFPVGSVWLKDSIFISDFEEKLGSWGVDYGIRKDSSVLKSAPMSFLLNYNVDSVYKTKDIKPYNELKKYSALLGVDYLVQQKVERPLVYVDSLTIFNYVELLNDEVNKIIADPNKNWFWRRFQKENCQVHYAIMTLEDFLYAVEKYHHISPKIVITDSMHLEHEVPTSKYDNYSGSQIIGLIDNASEIVSFDNQLYIVYQVTKDNIFITKYKKPEYHVGFRLKCQVIKGSLH